MNPISWPIDDRAVVRTLLLDDAEVVYRAVDENRDSLRPYMLWEKTTRSPDDVRAFAERLGFTHEATTRDGHRKSDDTYVDQVANGLLEHEWPAA